MANEKHLAVLKKGVKAWNRWKFRNPEVTADLTGADLRGAKLGDVNLDNANLSHADLCQAYLWGATFYGSKLTGSKFSEACLEDAGLNGADLTDANLNGANLKGAELNAVLTRATLVGADLEGCHIRVAGMADAKFNKASLIGATINTTMAMGANFAEAQIGATTFVDCDLRGAKGLDSVTHVYPTTIGIDTIFRSKGQISEDFLRGCGVPESLIIQIRSLVGAEDGIQFYSCFISYSGKDEHFAKRLHGKMRDFHLRVWFAPEDIEGGKKLHEQIETAIRVYDKLLVVLSEASLRSEWVMDELRKGFKAERDTGKRKLFPVRLTDYETLKRWECRDSISGRDLAEEVRQYFIPDFSNWKDHDQFEAAFARLLKDLRAEDRSA